MQKSETAKRAGLSLGSALLVGVLTAAGVAVVPTAAVHAEDYTSGVLTGQILAQDGTAVANASITIVGNSRGLTRSVTADADGGYRFPLLPVDSYKVTVSADNFVTYTDEAVRVNIGGATVIDFVIRSTMGVEEVVSTGTRSPGLDFESTTIGAVFDVEELTARLPVGRSVTDVALLAPGTRQGDGAFGNLPSIGGSSVGENVIIINGMNVTDFRNFINSTTVPFDFIQQSDIKTGGYQAEFGRSTGGVLNNVSKSGTNEWEYGFTYLVSPNGLREQAPDTATAANRYDVADLTRINGYVGGPLIEDQLFIFASYEMRDNQTFSAGTRSGVAYSGASDDPYYAVKLDWNINENHLLEYTFFSDAETWYETTYDFDPDSGEQGMAIGETLYQSGGDNQILKYTGVLRDDLTVSAMWGTNAFNRTVGSSTDANPAIYDSRNGCCVAMGNFASLSVSSGNDEREVFRFDVDYYLDDLMGSHHFRAGLDREDLVAVDSTRYSGGIYYRYYSGPWSTDIPVPFHRIRRYESGGSFNTIQTAFYIQDSWEITDQLTLNLGLRNETFDNQNAAGETFVELKNQLAPRLGFTFDPDGDGSSKFYGSYGHYYLPVATNTNLRLAGQEFFTAEYYETLGIGPGDIPIDGRFLGETIYSTGEIADVRALVDESLDPMYQEELILGYSFDGERFSSALEGWSFGVRGVYRNLSSTLEDVAVDAAVHQWCDANGIAGCEDVWTGFHSYILTNPGDDITFYSDEVPGSEGTMVRIDLPASTLGYPEVERTYKALEFTFDREWDGVWSLGGSYTLARSEGNYEGSVKSDNGQDDAGLTQDFDQPGLTDGSYGRLPNDRTHTFKAFGTYAVTDEFMVGANMSVQSPRQYGCIGYHPTDAFAYEYGASSWYCNGQLTPRGSQFEGDWVTNMDVSFIYNVANPGIGKQMQFRADVFNIFNLQNGVDFYEHGEDGGIGDMNPDYRQVSSYQAPRSVRLGVTVRF